MAALVELARFDLPDLEPSPHAGISVAVSPGGDKAAAGAGVLEPGAPGTTGRILLLDASAGRVLQRSRAHFRPVTCLAWSPDGALLASGGVDRSVIVRRVATGAELWARNPFPAPYVAIAFSPDGRLLAAATVRDLAHVFDAATGEIVATLSGIGEGAKAIAFACGGAALAIVPSRDGGVRFTDPRTGASLGEARGEVRCAAVAAADGSSDLIVFACEDGSIGEAAAGRDRVERRTSPGPPVTALALAAEGALLAAGLADGRIRLFAGRERRLAGETPAHAGRVTGLALTPDGARLVSAGLDRAVVIWDVARPTSLASCPDATGDAGDVALAVIIRDRFLAPARASDDAARTICDFACSEMQRDPGLPNFAEWMDENGARLRAGGAAAEAAREMQAFRDAWLARTRFTRSD